MRSDLSEIDGLNNSSSNLFHGNQHHALVHIVRNLCLAPKLCPKFPKSKFLLKLTYAKKQINSENTHLKQAKQQIGCL